MAVLRLAELGASGREDRFTGPSTVFRSRQPFGGTISAGHLVCLHNPVG